MCVCVCVCVCVDHECEFRHFVDLHICKFLTVCTQLPSMCKDKWHVVKCWTDFSCRTSCAPLLNDDS